MSKSILSIHNNVQQRSVPRLTRPKRRVSGPPDGTSGRELIDGSFRVGQVPKLDRAVLTRSSEPRFRRGTPVDAVDLGQMSGDVIDRRRAFPLIPDTQVAIVRRSWCGGNKRNGMGIDCATTLYVHLAHFLSCFNACIG